MIRHALLSSLLFTLVGCATQLQRDDPLRETVDCRLDAFRFSGLSQNSPKDNIWHSMGNGPDDKERDYHADMAALDKQYNYWLDLSMSYTAGCGPESVAAKMTRTKLEEVEEQKVRLFSSRFSLQKIEARKKARREFYETQNFSHSDSTLIARIANTEDSGSFMTINLLLTSAKKNKLLHVNAISMTSYLGSNGLQNPISVLTGIGIRDEFGNDLHAPAEAHFPETISPDRFTSFSFKARHPVANAKQIIITLRKNAFGNPTPFVIKAKPYVEPGYTALNVAIYKEFGLTGLMAESRQCYKFANERPSPIDYMDSCAITDMFANQIDEWVAKETKMAPEPYFSIESIQQRLGPALARESSSMKKANEKMNRWEETARALILQLGERKTANEKEMQEQPKQ